MTSNRSIYTIGEPSPEDRPAIRELFQQSLGVYGDQRFWEWKHLDNPFGETFWLVAKAGDEVVGARAFMQWQWRARRRSYRAVRAVDTATHPDWRRRGIFTNLTKQMLQRVRDDGVDFVFNTPNDKSRPGYLKMGWEVVDAVPVWVKPIRPFRAAGRLLPVGDDAEADIGFETSNVEELLEQMDVDALLRSTYEGESRLHTDRSAEYLRWRYSEVPDITYRARWRGDADAGAFAVFRRRQRGGLTELMLSELAATPGLDGMRALRGLLGEAVAEWDVDYAIGSAARNTTEMWAMATSGFLPAPKVGPTLVYRQLSGALPDERLRDWTCWRCGIGDLALF